MKTGKISEIVLKRSVIGQLNHRSEKALSNPHAGEDCAFLQISSDEQIVLSSHAESGTIDDMEQYVFQVVANNLASGGAETVGVMSTILLPENYEEADLKAMMKRLDIVAESLNITVLGGHTEVSPYVSAPVISITGVGTCPKGCGKMTGNAKPGQDVVLSKWIGIQGTAILARKYEEKLQERFSEAFVSQAQAFLKYLSVAPEAAVAMKSGVSAMHDVSRGGIFAALWELAEAAGVGLDIDLKKIPIRQETVEVCEIFDVNPYTMVSGGALLMVADKGEDLVRQLEREGIPAMVIGKTTDGNDRTVRNEEEVRFLEPPRQDDFYKL